MAKINIEFDGKIYSVDENTLAPLASPLERALIQQLAGTGAVIRFGSTTYNVDANKLASARNVLINNFGKVAGTDSNVTVAGTEYGLSKTKLQGATDKIHETLGGMATAPASEGLEFELNEDGASYSLVGRGTCTDTDIVIPDTYEGLPVKALKTRIEYIEAKGHVYPQETGTFMDCIDIKSVTIPDSVTTIGYEAFYGCTGLMSVTIGNSVTSIGYRAFHGCSSLINIAIPDSVTNIDSYAFYGCSSLTSVTIPDIVTNIGPYAFRWCDSLISVTIGNSVTSIGNFAFENCYKLVEVINKSSLNITKGSTNNGYVAAYALEVHNNESKIVNKDGYLFYTADGINYLLGYAGTDADIVLPANYNGENYNIYGYAFGHNDNLTSLTIPSAVETIGDNAFYYCDNLTNVTIPNSITSIGFYAFSSCYNLTDIYINKSEGSVTLGDDWCEDTVTVHWNSTGPET